MLGSHAAHELQLTHTTELTAVPDASCLGVATQGYHVAVVLVLALMLMLVMPELE